MKYPETILKYIRIDNAEKFKKVETWFREGLEMLGKKTNDIESTQVKYNESAVSVNNPDFYFFTYYNDNGTLAGFSLAKIIRSNFEKNMLLDDVYCPNYKYSGQIMEFVYNIAKNERCSKVVLVLSRDAEAFDRLIQKRTFLKSKQIYQLMLLEEK